MLLEPLNALLLRIIHGLLILLALKVSPQRKPVNLILIDPDLARQAFLALLLFHEALDLVDLLRTQQAVRTTQCKGSRDSELVKVGRDRDQRRVTSVYCVDAFALHTREGLLASQNSVPPSPAETNDANLVRAWNVAGLVNEVLNQRTSNRLAMANQPRTEGCARLCRRGSAVDHGARLTLRKTWLDGVKEADGKGVAFVDVGNIDCEASFGIVVCEEAYVVELPSEDYELVRGLGGRAGTRSATQWFMSLLSTRKMTVLDLFPSAGSAM